MNLYELNNNNQDSVSVICICFNCGWKGGTEKCKTEKESESWEMAHIISYYFYCPKCGKEITDFNQKKEVKNENK